ncbi:hypothetical protein SALBM217S_04227 [Streptomyces griseoloalbus]
MAAGRLDGYYERGLHPWDLAAGALIAREAGALTSARHPGTPPSNDLTVAASQASSPPCSPCWTSSEHGTTEPPGAGRRRPTDSGGAGC